MLQIFKPSAIDLQNLASIDNTCTCRLAYGVPRELEYKDERLLQRLLRDPHLTLLKTGLTILLGVELYKFIGYVAAR